MQSFRPKEIFKKINIFVIAAILVTAILVIRLFYLQVVRHGYYAQIADNNRDTEISLLADRGSIYFSDQSGETYLAATNITLHNLYVDPTLVEDPEYLTKNVAPLIFDLEKAREEDNERIKEIEKTLDPELPEEEKADLLKALSDEELQEKFQEEFREKISAKQKTEMILTSDLDQSLIKNIKELKLSGIEVQGSSLYAYPPQILDRQEAAEALAPLLKVPTSGLEEKLKGNNRYVVLERKLSPEVSEKIQEMQQKAQEELALDDDLPNKMGGIGLEEEYHRFYPEGALASSVIGYIASGSGQYGIESYFDKDLKGNSGKLETKRDSLGRPITVGESDFEEAVNGDDIVLTIDRSIQLKTEEILGQAVESYRADSGQVIVMNPQTGEILAMANYPTYDPNEYGNAFKLVEQEYTEEQLQNLYPSKKEKDTYYYYTNSVTLDYYRVFVETDEEGNKRYYRYENYVGPEVYHNKIISWPYEPGSVFKSITMAIGIDNGEIAPNTSFNDSGPVGVGWNSITGKYDYEIGNSTGKYFGLITMNTVLAESLNTGMIYVANKLGPDLFYNHAHKAGFFERTDIQLPGEAKGLVQAPKDWDDSELATHSFGQGLTVTMLQLANAYSSLANGGLLMRPYVVKELHHDDGTVTNIEPYEIGRVYSEETSDKMTAMLTNSTENGVADNAQVEGHYVAGKTGTSQTYKNGEALSGAGTTITSFAGYGPIDDPQFVVIVKFDKPKSSEWGSETAAPTFSKIANYLFDYYNVPPDKAGSFTVEQLPNS